MYELESNIKQLIWDCNTPTLFTKNTKAFDKNCFKLYGIKF
jgi:hypothetical protein